MIVQNFGLMDPESLIAKANENLPAGQSLVLGEFRGTNGRLFASLRALNRVLQDRIPIGVGDFQIKLIAEREEIDWGKLHVQFGELIDCRHRIEGEFSEGEYVSAHLITNVPIELRKEVVLPSVTRIRAIKYSCREGIDVIKRRTCLRDGTLEPYSIENALPTEWFFRKGSEVRYCVGAVRGR